MSIHTPKPVRKPARKVGAKRKHKGFSRAEYLLMDPGQITRY